MAKTLRDTASGVGKTATGTARGATRAASSAGAAARGTATEATPATCSGNRCRTSPEPWPNARYPGFRAG